MRQPELLTIPILNCFQKIWRQEWNPDPLMILRMFTPDSNWTWYATEYYPDTRQFFWLVVWFEKEWWRFSLDELENIRWPHGLSIERDLYFNPTRLSELGII